MSEARKRQAKIWTLVDTGDMNADEFMESKEKEVSKGMLSAGKQCHFCIHHNRFKCKHMCHTCVNEIGVKVVEESLSHDHDPMVEEHAHSLSHHVKEKIKGLLETNCETTPKVMCTKTQAA